MPCSRTPPSRSCSGATTWSESVGRHPPTASEGLGESELDERLEGAEPVTPGDLLALVGFTTGIGNRYFVNPITPTEEFGRDLGFEVEPIRHHRETLEHPTI